MTIIKMDYFEQKLGEAGRVKLAAAHLDWSNMQRWSGANQSRVSFIGLYNYLKKVGKAEVINMFVPSFRMRQDHLEALKKGAREEGVKIDENSPNFIELLKYLFDSKVNVSPDDVLSDQSIMTRALIKYVYLGLLRNDENSHFQQIGYRVLTRRMSFSPESAELDVLQQMSKSLVEKIHELMGESVNREKEYELALLQNKLNLLLGKLRTEYVGLSKCNLDQSIVVEAMKIKGRVAQVFFSGDGGFVSLYEELYKKKQMVFVVHPDTDSLSRDIKRQASKGRLALIFPERIPAMWSDRAGSDRRSESKKVY